MSMQEWLSAIITEIIWGLAGIIEQFSSNADVYAGLVFMCTAPYLLGSIPFGLILTQIMGAEDIRTVGSGNIGATNVLRTGNKALAALTLLLDMSKGFLAVWINLLSNAFLPYTLLAFGAIGSVIGHIFPVWLKFKGGKGVATAIGAFFALHILTGIIIIIIWVAVFTMSRVSSLSSIISLGMAPIIFLITYDCYYALIAAIIATLVIYRHKDNIKRLIAGNEPKFGRKQ